MDFKKKPLPWANEGVEPSDALKAAGFVGGYKPPAATFNYFLNNSGACIEELQAATQGLEVKGSTHESNKNNPHAVTKSQVGLSNADNTSDINKPVSAATQSALNNKVDTVSGKQLSTNDYTTAEKNKLTAVDTNLIAHRNDKNNPHSVTAAQVGAEAVGAAAAVDTKLTTHKNDKANPHSVTATQVGAIATTAKGVANGVASLDGSGKVPSGQLPTMNFDPAGSAAAVDAKLTTHTNNKSNPHGVTIAQIGAAASTHSHSNYAPLASPTFTGEPKAPAYVSGSSTTARIRNITLATSLSSVTAAEGEIIGIY